MNQLEHLYQQAKDCGIAILDYPMPTALSVALSLGGVSYIGIDRSRMETSSEEAECLAHEIGHLSTGALYAIGERQRSRCERKAEVWAINRLVPRKRFLAACRAGCHEVWEFAEELGITYAFAEKVVAYYLAATVY